MKILSRNRRGLAQPSTIHSLRAIIRKTNPDMLFLSETKTASHHVSSILHQLGFSMLVQAPPSSSRGGLLLAWETDVILIMLGNNWAVVTKYRSVLGDLTKTCFIKETMIVLSIYENYICWGMGHQLGPSD